jgi:GPH family glycoside/pentoside/hexuronide:cation symporter
MSTKQEKSVKKISAMHKTAWGLGATADSLMTNSISYAADKIYTIGMGVNPAVLGIVMAIPRLVDAISDPLMGNISDNTKSRFGRRRPYILLGAILCGFMFALLWSPPAGLGVHALAIYVLIVSILYYLAYTIFAVPWSALGLEMSDNYNERTRIQAYRTFIAAVSGIALGWMWKLAFVFGGGDDIKGIRKVGLLFGFIILFAGMIPLFCKERITTQSQKKIHLMKAFAETVKNGPFLLICSIVFLIMLGLFLVQRFGGFINVYYVFGGDKEAVSELDIWCNTIFQVMGFALVPLISFMATRIGKKKMLLIAEGIVGAAFLTSWFFYNPHWPYLQLIFFAMIAPGLSCVWMLASSMIADVCDVDELKTGMRREGFYSAVFSFVCKAGISGTLLLSGFILNWTGYDAKQDVQSGQTLLTLRILYMVIPTCFFTIAFILTVFYPITESKVNEIRKILNDRKNELQ